jgi:putative redox protein
MRRVISIVSHGHRGSRERRKLVERYTVNLTVEHVDGMRFVATTDEHAVITDASPQDGGEGTAMSAPQMFVAALGACVLEFVLNSCRLRRIAVERLRIEIEFAEVPKPRRVGALEATIRIEPDPPDEVKKRLVSVARHATLVNTLERPPGVRICFAETGNEAHAEES